MSLVIRPVLSKSRKLFATSHVLELLLRTESVPATKQWSCWKPKQVPQTGNVFPFLSFSWIAYSYTSFAFFWYGESITYASPPGNKTPFTLDNNFFITSGSWLISMGTTLAPALSRYLTYDAEMYESPGIVGGNGLSGWKCWANTPMIGLLFS